MNPLPKSGKTPWRLSARAQIIGAPSGMAIFLILFFSVRPLHNGFTLFLAALVPVAAFINSRTIARSRSRLADPSARKNEFTGVRVTPLSRFTSPGTTAQTRPMRWRGGADMVGGYGRIPVNRVAVLELDGTRLTLGFSAGFGRLSARMVGCEPVSVVPLNVEEVFAARMGLKYLGVRTAIGIRPIGQPPSYFMPHRGKRARILTAIEAAGFRVEWREKRFSYS